MRRTVLLLTAMGVAILLSSGISLAINKISCPNRADNLFGNLCIGTNQRIAIHQGNGFILAETGGAEEITLTVNQIPAHSHPMLANSQLASEFALGNRVFAQPTTVDAYVQPPPMVQLSSQSCSAVGGSQPHTNFQPYLCVDFIISLFGIFPSQT
jgi:microcystin-dependent protein